jgi:regulator of protease activity HflC (stomatin/prohibitin superfamily)
MFQPCFLAVERSERMTAKSLAPSSERNPPEFMPPGASLSWTRGIAEAVGETDRFLALWREYEKAPEITRSRLYLEAMEKILPKVKLYGLDTDNGHAPLNLSVTGP